MKIFKKSVFSALFLTFFIASCSTPSVMYKSNYMPYTPTIAKSDQISGKVLVVMSSDEENYTLELKPSSFTGGAIAAVFDIGRMTKEITMSSYSVMFTEGAYFSNQPESGYSILVTPSINKLDYKFDQMSALGFAVTPIVDVSLMINIIDADGNSTFSREYISGEVKGKAYMVSGSPHEEINKVLHKTIFDLVEDSKNDLKRNLSK
jgi:hypothetical protein